MANETTPLVARPAPGSKNRASGTTGSHARKRRSTMRSKKHKATKTGPPVLGNIFEAKDEPSSRPERRVKSWMYTLLNPKSLQLHAVIFKYFIATIIVADFLFYVVSTEPVYQKELPPLFAWEEAITSYLFLFEYIARLWTITEHHKYRGQITGRLKYLVSYSALIDLFATMPYFVEEFTTYELPQLTYLRTFRLFRILKTNSFMKAGDAVRRVLYYNRQIMTLSVFVGLYMILFTSLLMYQLRPRETESKEFESIPSTMYLATLMLTGQGGPEGDLPWYTKAVVLVTSAFSIGMFAIPVSMLTWGFEAEAERCAKRSRQLAKREASTNNIDDVSTDEYSTDEDYQKIIAGVESSSSSDGDDSAIARVMKAAFDTSDVDGSGSISFEEFMKLSQSRTLEAASLEGRVAVLEDKLDEAIDKIDKLCKHFAVRT
ncbi:unnamed protein product [Cylindrotheca closterium]|uniref:EF-hand domain-containing protein n=1 Tax=Cylindrotheca closterium TaxID=2856 RepID=A0AAD2JHG8_9STRA|nr:unnamed protein product [Cylindrotheca closterium]